MVNMKILLNMLLVICPVLGQSIPLSVSNTKIGCENTTISLSRPISIVRANYGRFAMSVCNHQEDVDMRTDCGTEELITSILRKR
jgi:hypothetical protein